MKSSIAKGNKRGPAATERRTETISGTSVTIIIKNGVETVRGAPKCRWCGKTLRPRYTTQRQPEETRHHYDQKPKHIAAVFDDARKQWVVVSKAYRIIKRSFEGAFGTYGDNQFCGLNCGRDFGVAVAEGIARNELRVLDRKGRLAVIAKTVEVRVVPTASRRGGPNPKSE